MMAQMLIFYRDKFIGMCKIRQSLRGKMGVLSDALVYFQIINGFNKIFLPILSK